MRARLLDFDDIIASAPPTEGIKYTGSKLKLLPQILELAKRTGANSVFDGFSGSTRVSQAFAQEGYRVISNDLSTWSKTFATCYLKNQKNAKTYQPLIEHLNAVAAVDGWFTENYGGNLSDKQHNAIQTDGTKKPWQKKNTRKLDGIREEIDRLQLDEVTKCIALTALILAMDQVDSTLGHYVSYLKDWSPRSFKNINLTVPHVWQNTKNNIVLNGDVFDVLEQLDADLAYFDPPYGSNNEKMPPSRVRYASYYHIWTTICLNDKPKVFGKALRRHDTSDRIACSVFEEFRRNDTGQFMVIEAIERLLKATPCEWIILSYSSGGRATAQDLNEVIHENGKLVDTIEVDYKKHVMATMKWTNKWLKEVEESNKEFLFLIKKG